MFQHTAARRRLPKFTQLIAINDTVSTHSRTKAAASQNLSLPRGFERFNTQPHEGGCIRSIRGLSQISSFNTQPHEGGCLPPTGGSGRTGLFQHTAARRRLPIRSGKANQYTKVSTHSRAEAAAFGNAFVTIAFSVSTHSRAEAAAVWTMRVLF